MTATLLALALAALPAYVEVALQEALADKAAHLDVRGYRPHGAQTCAATSASVAQPITASGPVAVRVIGQGCEDFAWADVRVLVPGYIVTKVLREGELLEGALTAGEVEVHVGQAPVQKLPQGARAARNLASGTHLEARHLRGEGPSLGASVKVEVRAGALVAVQLGRAVGCVPGRACAILPGGRRVEGIMQDGRIIVEAP